VFDSLLREIDASVEAHSEVLKAEAGVHFS
jgi:hypothetical protein